MPETDAVMKPITTLLQRISSRDAVIGVIGMGYVGLPLAIQIISAGFDVYGIDCNVDRLNSLRSFLSTESHEVVDNVFELSNNFSLLEICDIVIICVPTPLSDDGISPDLSYIKRALDDMFGNFRIGQLVVLESSTYPGTTCELVSPIIEQSGFKIGEDIFVAYSPERINPGSQIYSICNTPRIVGGITERCAECAKEFYMTFVNEIHVVSDTRVAETVKLLENTYRFVNIALVNEWAMICKELGIDIWEVLKAAETKPFGFQRFNPGSGIGGHCIPVDPLYFEWVAKRAGYSSHLIEAAYEVNTIMPQYVVHRIEALIAKDKFPNVLIMGVAYKPNVNDYRESPALRIMVELRDKGIQVDYYDPYVDEIVLRDITWKSINLGVNGLRSYQLIVLHTPHDSFDYGEIFRLCSLIFDLTNAMELRGFTGLKIFKL